MHPLSAPLLSWPQAASFTCCISEQTRRAAPLTPSRPCKWPSNRCHTSCRLHAHDTLFGSSNLVVVQHIHAGQSGTALCRVWCLSCASESFKSIWLTRRCFVPHPPDPQTGLYIFGQRQVVSWGLAAGPLSAALGQLPLASGCPAAVVFEHSAKHLLSYFLPSAAGGMRGVHLSTGPTAVNATLTAACLHTITVAHAVLPVWQAPR